MLPKIPSLTNHGLCKVCPTGTHMWGTHKADPIGCWQYLFQICLLLLRLIQGLCNIINVSVFTASSIVASPPEQSNRTRNRICDLHIWQRFLPSCGRQKSEAELSTLLFDAHRTGLIEGCWHGSKCLQMRLTMWVERRRRRSPRWIYGY